MSQLKPLSILFAIALLASPPTRADGEAGDGISGAMWKKMDANAHLWFIAGVMEGVKMGETFTEFPCWTNDKPAKYQQGCADNVKAKFLDTYKALAVAPDNGTILEGVDQFYRDPNNQKIPVDIAVFATLRRIAGDSSADDYISNMRKNY